MRGVIRGGRRRLRRASHIVTAGLTAGALCTAALAQDATWKTTPADDNYNNTGNWTPNQVPGGTATFAASNITNLTFSTATSVDGWTFNTGASNYTFTVSAPNALTFTGDGILINGGSAAIINNSFLNFQNTSTAGTATITNNSNTTFFNASTAGDATITNNSILNFNHISTAGSATISNNGIVDFNNSSAAGSANITNTADLINFNDTSTAGNANLTVNGGAINFNNGSTAGNAIIAVDGGLVFFLNASTAAEANITNNTFVGFFDASTGGSAAITNNMGGVVDFSASSGPNGDRKLSAGSIDGAGNFYLGADQLTIGGNNFSTTVRGVISDCGAAGTDCEASSFAEPSSGGSLVKVGSGTLTLTGINTYTGATTVNAGILEVDGSIATSSLTAINSGATLLGTGTVGNLQINSGGTFAPGALAMPGTFLTVLGNLAFQPGALYLVQVDPTAATSATVTGSATLGGDVGAMFANGLYVTRQYDILHAGSINGTFDGLETLNLPPGVLASLAYTPTDVFLDLSASLPTQGLNLNQRAVANAIDNFFNNGGALPPSVFNLFNLTGANLGNALTVLDGGNATGAEHAAFQLMTEFLGLMLDPYVDGRNGGGAGGPLPFAPDQDANFPSDMALVYAGVLKAPPKQTFTQRWTAWASGFGGSTRTDGDPVIGSTNVTTNTFGYAAGMDYHHSPDTVLGFALAGGGTSWNLVQGLGTGRSDAFLAGVYGVTHHGPAYVAGALAFANDWFTTKRTALGDQLGAGFQGQSYAAQLEGGYRFALPVAHNALGATPYAAIQAQTFHTPAYSETDLTAGGFGLSYAAVNGTNMRSELGARFDDHTAINTLPLILRASAAWAHDWVGDPTLNASLQALPGAGFTVFGAPFPHDSALTSAGAQLFFTPHWSLLGKFDGEFAKGSQTYAGTGTLRYTW